MLKRLLFPLLIASLLMLALSFPILSMYRGKAKMIQRVQKTSGNEMFGDDGTPIGEPMLLILEDEKAFITPGADDTGTYHVDENYLTEHKIHPLQLKTVEFIASICQFVFGMSAVILAALKWVRRRKATALDGS